MRDRNVDWCYEGGCTYQADADDTSLEQVDTTELETLYSEPCIGMFD